MSIVKNAALKKEINQANFDELRKGAVKLCIRLQQYGPKTFLVGGAVRDMLLGLESIDIDIATELRPPMVKQLLEKMRLPFFDVGEKYGTIGTIINGTKIEITTFRSEHSYADYRHPKKIKFIGSPKSDASRRDFTVNSLFFVPSKRAVLDYAGGLHDLKTKTIRFVGSASKRILEDPLRMLRAVRFATVLDFKIAPKDFKLIRKKAALILKVSGERIKNELDKIMASKNYIRGIKLLDKSGLLELLLPEVHRLKKVRQSKNVHAEGNAFVHTLKVLENSKGGDMIFRYAALFHDIGKFGTAFKTHKDGREHLAFLGHAKVGAEMFTKISRRLAFPAQQRKKIEYLIENHMLLLFPERVKEETLIKNSKHKYFQELVSLRIADSMGAIMTDSKGKKLAKNLDGLYSLLHKSEQWKKNFSGSSITGKDVMRILGIKQGEQIGKILEQVDILRAKGVLSDKADAIKYLESLDKHAV